MKVLAYTKYHQVYEFRARDLKHAREIATRIVNEHLWVTEEEGAGKNTEVFFPVNQLIKVKIIKQ
jgi:hypothetical protein